MRQIEVLAPAGSFETMKAAYKAGADAVYMGGPMFGARAYADNADMEQMLSAIDYAHLHGRKLYMTVNTLLKNIEIERQLTEYIRPFYEQGLDAVIVQDLGVMTLIHTLFPDMAIHASTQMTVCGTQYGEWLRDHGASRIVTPRELDLSEIANMKRRTGVEIETFVHGALCYCYSGQCLMSSMIGGRSGKSPFEKGEEPLVVIDGKVFKDTKKLEGLDPGRIENISVLKDASAVEKYGRKARNGVIEITTRKK